MLIGGYGFPSFQHAGRIWKRHAKGCGTWWEYRNKVGGRFVYEWLLEGVSKDVFSEPMAPLGQGAQDVPAIARAAGPHIEWMVIEMDVVATDVYQAIKDSRDYLLRNKFAAG